MSNSKLIWKTMKPFFSEKASGQEKITLVDDKKIITKDAEVAETLNKYFLGAVKSLDIEGYNSECTSYTGKPQI